MKSETEIRDRLTYYQKMLSSIRIAQVIDNPEVFIAVSERFPNEAIALLRSSQGDDIIKEATANLQRLVENKICTLKWVLEENVEDRDV